MSAVPKVDEVAVSLSALSLVPSQPRNDALLMYMGRFVDIVRASTECKASERIQSCCDIELITAAYEGNAEYVSFLVGTKFTSVHQEVENDRESLPDALQDRYITPLHAGIVGGHQNVVRLLLRLGAKVNDGSLPKPIHIACRARRADILRDILRAGARTAIMDEKKRSALFCVCHEGDAATLRVLLEERPNIDVHEIDSDQRTALHIVAGRGDLAMVNLLLDKEAAVTTMDRFFKTPYREAFEKDHADIVERFLDHTSQFFSLAQRDSQGYTQLQRAAQLNLPKVVALLLRRGVDPNEKSGGGRSAHKMAMDAGFRAIADMIAAAPGFQAEPVEQKTGVVSKAMSWLTKK